MKFGSTVLFVDDVPAVLEFYRRALGFETRFYDAEYQFGELDAYFRSIEGTIIGLCSPLEK
jgi:catechol 2,3-dioxygenase-like lactoylglutathione lyase family enzyme